MTCARLGIRTDGCILVCTHIPCAQCAGPIINAGITKVIAKEPTTDFSSRWMETNSVTIDMFAESGVELIILKDELEL